MLGLNDRKKDIRKERVHTLFILFLSGNDSRIRHGSNNERDHTRYKQDDRGNRQTCLVSINKVDVSKYGERMRWEREKEKEKERECGVRYCTFDRYKRVERRDKRW